LRARSRRKDLQLLEDGECLFGVMDGLSALAEFV
jgi:hypothetical protein